VMITPPPTPANAPKAPVAQPSAIKIRIALTVI
jgi:hypothetical protein